MRRFLAALPLLALLFLTPAQAQTASVMPVATVESGTVASAGVATSFPITSRLNADVLLQLGEEGDISFGPSVRLYNSGSLGLSAIVQGSYASQHELVGPAGSKVQKSSRTFGGNAGLRASYKMISVMGTVQHLRPTSGSRDDVFERTNIVIGIGASF